MRRWRRWRGQTVPDEVAAPSRKSILGCIEGYRFVEEVVIIVWSVMLILLVDRGLGADDGCRTVLDGVPCHIRIDVPVKRFLLSLYNRSLAGILGYGVPFSPRDPPAHVHHLRAAIVLFSAFLRTWRAVGRGIFPLFHLTIVLASLLVHVWMAARSVTVTGTTSRPLPTSSSTCRTGGTLSRIPRAGVLYWDDIDNGTSVSYTHLTLPTIDPV